MKGLDAYGYQALDIYSVSHGDGKMLLTVACPAGKSCSSSRDQPILNA